MILTSLTLLSYFVLALVLVFHALKEAYYLFSTVNIELKKHRMEHLIILIALILFNIALILTNTRDGFSVFFDLLNNNAVVLLQYIFMSLFMYLAGSHLNDEIKQLENHYGK